MFETILNKNHSIKRIQTTSHSVFIVGAVVLLLMVVFFIWQEPLNAYVLQDEPATTQQIRTSIIETILVISLTVPLILQGKTVLKNWFQSQSFFQTLFQDSVEPILLYKLNGQITACNPALEKLLGYTTQELKEMKFQDLIVSDGQELAHLFRMGESGNHAQATLALEGRDQRILFAIAHEQRIQIRGKVQLLTFLEDITASHIENQKNQILGDITSTLLETQDIRQVHQTVCAEIVRSADSLVVLLGIFIQGRGYIDIVEYNGAKRQLEQFREWKSDTLAPGELHKLQIDPDHETWLGSKTLTPFSGTSNHFPLNLFAWHSPPNRVFAGQLFQDENEITSVIILDYKENLDISFTEQMLYFFNAAIGRLVTQEKLNRSQTQLSETQTLVKVGRLQYDYSTDRSIISKELCMLLGVPENASAIEITSMVHPEDRPAFARLLDKIIEYPTQEQIRFNFRAIHADGHTLYLRSQSKIHFTDTGKPDYLITAIHDATELISTRDQLKAKEGAYHQLVKERQMLEERVSVQVSELENVNRNLNTALMVKDEFLASMSSNLKAPLTAILGATELLTHSKKDDLSPDQTRYVDLIERSGYELLNSINTLLDLTKFSLNKEEISQEKVNLRDLCQASLHYSQSFANRKQVQLQYEFSTNHPYVIGDPIRLRQIITILLRQAIQSSPEKGKVRLIASTHTDPEYIQIQISDKADRSVTTILEPDRHGLDPNNQQSLELEIATRLIEMHGGKLTTNFKQKYGNQVNVLLPRRGNLSPYHNGLNHPDQDTVNPDEINFRR